VFQALRTQERLIVMMSDDVSVEQVVGAVADEAPLRYEAPTITSLDVLGVLVRGASGGLFDDLSSCTSGSDFNDDAGAC
jgi:hypothetical protein